MIVIAWLGRDSKEAAVNRARRKFERVTAPGGIERLLQVAGIGDELNSPRGRRVGQRTLDQHARQLRRSVKSIGRLSD
jgi:hypothetical protein